MERKKINTITLSATGAVLAGLCGLGIWGSSNTPDAPPAPPAKVVEQPAPAVEQPAPVVEPDPVVEQPAPANYFKNCAAAKEAGKSNLKASDYPNLEDRDHDGVVCES